MSQENQPQEIVVKIKKEENQQINTENQAQIEALEAENTKLLEQLTAIKQTEFEKRKKALNAPEDIIDPDTLHGYELAKKEQQEANFSTNQGGTPLTSAQYGEPNQKQVFNSYKEMFDELSVKAKTDPNAKAILNKLWEKSLNGQKESGNAFKTIDIPPSELMEKIRKPRR